MRHRGSGPGPEEPRTGPHNPQRRRPLGGAALATGHTNSEGGRDWRSRPLTWHSRPASDGDVCARKRAVPMADLSSGAEPARGGWHTNTGDSGVRGGGGPRRRQPRRGGRRGPPLAWLSRHNPTARPPPPRGPTEGGGVEDGCPPCRGPAAVQEGSQAGQWRDTAQRPGHAHGDLRGRGVEAKESHSLRPGYDSTASIPPLHFTRAVFFKALMPCAPC